MSWHDSGSGGSRISDQGVRNQSGSVWVESETLLEAGMTQSGCALTGFETSVLGTGKSLKGFASEMRVTSL